MPAKLPIVSEPRQIFGRLHLSRARFDELCGASFPDVSEDPGVLAWLAAGSYYGPRYTAEIVRERLAEYGSVREWLDAVVAPGAWGFPMPVRNRYDEAECSWTLGVLDFSENYDDYLAAVAVFRLAAAYKDLPGDDGMLIYGYMFGDNEISVALRVDIGQSSFLSEDEAGALVAQADETMEALMAEGAASAPLDHDTA